MAFFDEIGKKISQTGQNAVKKTKDIADVARINSLISDEEKNINNCYFQLGKLYIAVHAQDCESEFKGIVDSILQSENKITDYKEQICLIKGIVKCENCGADVSISAAFCNSCGASMPKRVTVPQEDLNLVKCSKCGNYVKKGTRFCSSCGHPMPQDEPIATNVQSDTSESNVAQVEEVCKKCPNCGFETSEDDILFCKECGTKLVEITQNDIPDDVPAPNDVRDTTQAVKKFPNCGFETSEEDILFCRECGTKLGDSLESEDNFDLPATNEVNEVSPNIKRCSNCGFETSDSEAVFCNNCGNRLS